MAVDIARLPKRPGVMLPVRDTVTSPFRIGLDMIAVQQGDPLDLDLVLQSVSEGVLVTGTVTGPTSGECARCLGPIQDQVQVTLTELFAYPHSVTDATTDEDEISRVVDDMIDLEQLIIDAVGLALPLAPACHPECPGLCAECGIPLATAGDHHHEQIDPRWAKLADLTVEGDIPRGRR